MDVTSQNNEIDLLTKEVDNLGKSLNDLQNNIDISNSKKKKQAETIISDAENTEQKIQLKINNLSSTGIEDDDCKAMKIELENLLMEVREIMNKSKAIKEELENLSMEVNESTKSTSSHPSTKNGNPETESEQGENKVVEETNEKKGFFSGIKDRFLDRVDDFKSRDKFKEKPVNWLLAGSVVGGLGALVMARIKKGKEKKKNEEIAKSEKENEGVKELEKNETKSDGFFKKIRKTTKGIIVGGITALGIQGILRYFGLIGKGGADTKSSDEEKFNSYKEEIVGKPENKEKFENYESIGENIDTLYESIYDRELKSGYEDDLEMKRIAAEQSSKEQEVTVNVNIGGKETEIVLLVEVKNGKMIVNRKKDTKVDEELFQKIKVKQGEQNLPEGNIRVEDLLQLPAGVSARFKNDEGIDLESNTEENFKGIVPYCLDNHFKCVEDILGQNSSMKEAVSNGINGMITYIKGKGNDFIQLVINNYLDRLPSWGPFRNLAGSYSDKIDQRKIKNENSEKEMQYFFRQSIRIQTYLFEKKDQLAEKIIKQSASKYGISEDEIRGDDEKFKRYVIDDPDYQNFLKNPIHSAVTILKNHNIFDGSIREKMKESVEELDNQRDEVLSCKKGEKDILELIEEKKEKGEKLTEEDDKLLEKACDGIIKDIDDNILDAVEESAWSIYGDLLGFDDNYLSEYVNKSGLIKVFQEYKKNILDNKSKLVQKEFKDDEGKINLARYINAMLALKKEAKLGSQTIERDYDENGNIIYRVSGFLKGSIENLVKGGKKIQQGKYTEAGKYLLSTLCGVGLIITPVGIFTAAKGRYGLLKTGAQLATLPISVPYEGLIHVKRARDTINRINYPFKFIGEKGPKKLITILKDGKISLEKASKIAERKSLGLFGSVKRERRRKEFYKIVDSDKGVGVRYKVFDQLLREHGYADTTINSLHDDNALYDTLVKNYDTSPELRESISRSRNSSLDELKRLAEQTTIHVSISENPHYKKIIEDLNLYETQTRNGRQIEELSNAERRQLDNIKELRETIKTMEEREIERTAELLGEFKGSGTLGEAIDQFKTLRNLEGRIVETSIRDGNGRRISKNIDEIIKNMDFSELRSCKGMLGDISDEAIESLAKTFESIRKSQVLKFAENTDEIAKLVKTLVTTLAKVK